MRILLCSHVFEPSVGGIETVSRLLADQFTRFGSTVSVVTSTPGNSDARGYEIVRRPPLATIRDLAREVDVVFQNNISLRTMVPLLLSRKPVVVTHQTWLKRATGRRGWQDFLKLAALRLCHNISISSAVAGSLPVPSTVIGNPFEPGEFLQAGAMTRPKDIVFMGRLVSDKGCELVLRALAILKGEGLCPSFTVIGDGPEMPKLRGIAEELGLSNQVTFRGTVRKGRGAEVVQHKIMVVPSIWAEPFGVVALEGIAAGCAIVASEVGGLPEAVGPCGLFFPGGDVSALAVALKRLLTDVPLRESLVADRERHLEGFRPEVIARRYLEFFASVANA